MLTIILLIINLGLQLICLWVVYQTQQNIKLHCAEYDSDARWIGEKLKELQELQGKVNTEANADTQVLGTIVAELVSISASERAILDILKRLDADIIDKMRADLRGI